MDRRTRGAHAETLALDHLLAHRLALVARNYRCRRGEIDLIMRDGADLVFVEVRYRRRPGFGGAAASVDYAKQRKLALAASHYLSRNGGSPRCRFDVVALSGTLDAPQINWIRGAFET